MDKRPKLLDQVRNKIRLKHYSIRTEQTYVGWIKRFVHLDGLRHPATMGADEVRRYLSHLAVDRKVSASTQGQALNAIVFLYREVLGHDLGWLDGIERAKRPKRLPVVLSRSEVQSVLARLDGWPWLMASLLYGAGLRLMECLRLRVKDMDFEYRQVVVGEGKGRKDRVTMLPQAKMGRLITISHSSGVNPPLHPPETVDMGASVSFPGEPTRLQPSRSRTTATISVSTPRPCESPLTHLRYLI